MGRFFHTFAVVSSVSEGTTELLDVLGHRYADEGGGRRSSPNLG